MSKKSKSDQNAEVVEQEPVAAAEPTQEQPAAEIPATEPVAEPEVVVPAPKVMITPEEQFASDLVGAVICQGCNKPVTVGLSSALLIKLCSGRGHVANDSTNCCPECGTKVSLGVSVTPAWKPGKLATVKVWQDLKLA